MLGGYMGKLLRVDLNNRTIVEEALPPEETLRKYVGCLGLAMKILTDEVPPSIQATDPDNRLIFLTGPLTGTKVPCANNFVVATINHGTGYTVGTAHSHGFWGAYLKFAGYDGIIVQGASDKPVYLSINNGEFELKDAGHIWGRDTHETEDAVKADIRDPEASVACIGPAGENVIFGACIENDYHHTAAKGGVGAVMGSKKLKAIAVNGQNRVHVEDERLLTEIVDKWREDMFREGEGGLADSPPGSQLRKAGITRLYNYLGKASAVAGKNLTDVDFGLVYSSNFVNEAKDWKIKPKSCFSCPIACGYVVEITSGPKAGYVATPAGGGENTEGAAGIIGVLDAGTAIWLTDLHDRLGLDSSSAGCTLGLAYELYERGILTKEDTGGLELKWGNADAAVKLLDMMIKREGIGKILAEGPKKAAELFGGDALKYAVHIKGTGYNLHDWRPAWSVLLGQAIAGAGPCWQAPGADWVIAPDLGYPKNPPGTVAEGKPKAVKETQIKKLWEDSLGICWFSTWGVLDSSKSAPKALAAVTGWKDFTTEEAFEVGERVINLQRIFNLRRGLTLEHDLDVTPRLLEAPESGVAKGKSIRPFLKDMVMEYYQLMGWERETGRPSQETLRRVGLEEYSDLVS